ncbi:acyl-CoA dehydrogenase family protein [Paracoccus onubensis]|uniref:Acyl-CoA dehydrogenase n=1 Tax=Paracoccus onubensis TaxID=1675788 RepID=A0A418SQE9_9RHOB|nr:acyl-CoA dehydrogenase family protein [Paracoccus onubensis]RJE83183.1 acyl-CoA dehydrogenase [Paracoccus onubensis]
MNDALHPDDLDRQQQLRMLIESAKGIAPRHGDFTRLRGLRFSQPGFDRDVWTRIAEMGWLGLRLPENAGGAGLGMLEYAALATEAGAALLPEPFIEVQLAIDMMGAATPPSVFAGDEIILPAWASDPDGLGFDGGVIVGRGGRLSGEKRFVPMGAAADRVAVATNAGIFLAAMDQVGIQTLPLQDGGHAATFHFECCPATPLEGDPRPALEAATVANAAYLLGVMERAFDITLEYLGTRRQFDRLIGSFQVLQHRAVDLKIQIEITRAVIRDACVALDGGNDAQTAVSRAKTRAAEAAMLVTRQAIQMHGAIGYTDEADIGLFLRKALTIGNRYGSASWHRARHAALTERDM